jgi:hypothetical protein
MLSKYENGHPVKCESLFGGYGASSIVGRIVGQCEEDGSWGEINGVRAFSISLIATPHGSIVKSGLFHLSDLDDADMEKLLGYEKELKDAGKELYAGKLKGILEQ